MGWKSIDNKLSALKKRKGHADFSKLAETIEEELRNPPKARSSESLERRLKQLEAIRREHEAILEGVRAQIRDGDGEIADSQSPPGEDVGAEIPGTGHPPREFLPDEEEYGGAGFLSDDDDPMGGESGDGEAGEVMSSELGCVENLTAIASLEGPPHIAVSWTLTDSSPADSFRVERADLVSGTRKATVVRALEFDDSSIRLGIPYSYSVTPCWQSVVGSQSTGLPAPVFCTQEIAEFAAVAVGNGQNGDVNLSWKNPEWDPKADVSLQLERDDGMSWLVSGRESFTDAGVRLDVIHWYRLKSMITIGGRSLPVAEITAKVERKSVSEPDVQAAPGKGSGRKRSGLVLAMSVPVILVLLAAALWIWRGVSGNRLRQEQARLLSMVQDGWTCLSQGESGDEQEWSGKVDAACGRLISIEGEKAEPAPPESLPVDESLYSGTGREAVRRFSEEYAQARLEYAEVDKQRQEMSAWAAQTRNKLQDGWGTAERRTVRRAGNALARCLTDMENEAKRPRPSARDMLAVEKAYQEARARLVAAQADLAGRKQDEDKVFVEIGEAESATLEIDARLEDLRERMSGIRKQVEKLGMSVAGRKRVLQQVETACKTAEGSEGKLAERIKAGRDQRQSLRAGAEAGGGDAISRLERLQSLHGENYIPQGTIETAKRISGRLEEALREDDRKWLAECGAADAALEESQRLRSEAGRLLIRMQDDNTATLPSGLAEMPARLDAARSAVESAMSGDTSLQALQQRVAEDMESLEALVREVGEPDWQSRATAIREAAAAARERLQRVQAKRQEWHDRLKQADGRTKERIEARIAQCGRNLPDELESALESILKEPVANGKDADRMQERLEKARRALDTYEKTIIEIGRELANVPKPREIPQDPVSWKQGALGSGPEKKVFEEPEWSPVLTPDSMEYRWDFALDIPRGGTHRIQVNVEKGQTPDLRYVAEFVDRKKVAQLVGRGTQKARAGWVTVACTLSAGKTPLATDTYALPNSGSTKRALALEAEAEIPAGRQPFSLKVGWQTDPSGPDSDVHGNALVFTIELDNRKVFEFWHR